MGWEKTLPLRQWHSSSSNYCISLLYCQHQIAISPLLSQTFLSLSAFRLRKQNMCTVRGELCIVSGPTRLLYKLWTSFGYAWAQMLCCMSQKHVRNGRLQVSNIFVYNFFLRKHDCHNIGKVIEEVLLPPHPNSIVKNYSNLCQLERKWRGNKSTSERLLFSNKSWQNVTGKGGRRDLGLWSKLKSFSQPSFPIPTPLLLRQPRKTKYNRETA